MKNFKIISNKIQCNHCHDIIESKSTHDMKWCSCKRVAVDGGKDYLRRCYANNKDDYTELSSFVKQSSNKTITFIESKNLN